MRQGTWVFRGVTLLQRVSVPLLSGLLGLMVSGPAAAVSANDFLQAADRGECIEHVAYRFIRLRGSHEAVPIVEAALTALARRVGQQRTLGCDGDIASQAIAAGGDPEQVLAATAANL